MKRLTFALVTAATLALASTPAVAGVGASYDSIRNAINSGSTDSIVAELERAEKLWCSDCVALVRPLIDSDDPEVRDVAAWWLAKRGVRLQVRDEMFARLVGSDTVAARNAAEVLGRFMHPEALMPLEIAMHDESLGDEARAAAATAVGTIAASAGKAVLEGALTSDSAEVRRAAAAALRELRGNTEAVALVPLLSDERDDVVREAARTIGALREASAAGGLLAVVTDLDRDVFARRDAAWALGRIGDGSARATLADVADEDPSMLVRAAARAALQNLR